MCALSQKREAAGINIRKLINNGCRPNLRRGIRKRQRGPGHNLSSEGVNGHRWLTETAVR